MKTKKGSILLICAAAIIVAGVLLSIFANWPVDRSGARGDIAKASRFSRQTAAESLSNLEELIRSDEDYKNAGVLGKTGRIITEMATGNGESLEAYHL